MSDLPALTPTERHQLLVEWNATQTEYPQAQNVHELCEAQVERTQDTVAVVFEDEHVTYEVLNRRANQLAHHLQTLGVRPDVLVGICLERSIEMVVSLLGILKAGGAYVPLDPAYPPERLAFMIQDARLTVLVTERNLQESLPELSAVAVCLDQEGETLAAASMDNLAPAVSPDGLAYVIYTSGSTGRPKGTLISQRALTNHMLWMQTTFAWQATDRVLQKTPFSFDASVWEFYAPLLIGGQLIMARPEGHRDGAYLVRTLLEQHVTVLQLVPTLLQVLVEEPRLEACACLTQVCCGGEALSNDLAAQLHARLPTVRLHNLYGPTEATIDATYWTWHSTPDQPLVPIGRPVANMQCYVLDESLQLVPIGVPGELFLSGIDLARGYWRRPDLTAEKFIPHPFSVEPGTRLYRTGDRCRYLPDGSLEFLGRIDHQVKIRGNRIELGEIEIALKQQPAVRQAVVVVREDQPGDKRLVAYVVPHEEQTFSISDLRHHLQAQLPHYMLPATFVVLKALPQTPNGKIDRQALPPPQQTEGEPPGVLNLPRTPLEETLAEIWIEVLQLKRVGIHANFFELGGHSLLATQIVTRLRQRWAAEFTVRMLFEAPTIALLAERIESITQLQSIAQPPLEHVRRDGPLPLSPGQQQLWLIDQLDPGNAAYNIAYPLRLQGHLDLVLLARSLSEIARRHEILRTTFSEIDRQPVQIIAAPQPVTIPVIDLRERPEPARTATALHLARDDARQPFDLAHGPVWRVTVLRVDDHEHWLLLTLHHIVVDGWSLDVLWRELGSLYTAFAADQPSPLPELSLQYGDYAVWQRSKLVSEEFVQQLADWTARLTGAPALLDLPIDHPRPPAQRFQGAREWQTLSPQLSNQLKHLSQQAGATLFMTLLAAFKVLLYRYSGQADLVVGTPIANRLRPEVENLIGYLVNMVVLRTRFAEHGTFREWIEQVRETALYAYARQAVPFEEVLKALQLERTRSYNPLFQVMFVVQNAPLSLPHMAGLQVTPVKIDPGIAQFDLSLEMEDSVLGLYSSIEYNTDLFEAFTIRRLLQQYQMLLESITADPDQPLATLLALIDIEPRPSSTAAAEAPENLPANQARIASRKAEIADQRAQLSAEEQALLERRLRPKGARH